MARLSPVQFAAIAAALVLSLDAVLPAGASAATTGAAGPAATDRHGEVQIETGLALPLGDLGAGFARTRSGMGAEMGYHLGLRLRFYLTDWLVAAPSFAYVEFGDHDGVNAADQRFTVQATALRYGLDALYRAPGAANRFRPYLGGGLAFVRNKFREEFLDPATSYQADVYALVGSLQAGVRLSDWDLALQYDINRFTTSLVTFDGEPLRYHWHSLLLRIGYTLPRF